MKGISVIAAALVIVAAFAAGYFVASRSPAGKPRLAGFAAHAAPSSAPMPTPARAAAEADASDSARPESRATSPQAAAPREILARLAALKVTAAQPKSARELLLQLENLRALGPAALPALREFLATAQDVDYDAALGRTGFRDGRVPTDFVVPPSLRLGLLEVVKNIGGAAAEELLARELKTTGRGVEAAYIAGALQQLAPDKYQEASLAAARDLLAMPLTATAKNPLDRSDREYLYNVLAAAGDPSQLGNAQASLVLPNGTVDRGALRYLQQVLGEQSIAIAAQAWDDPRVPATQREPLARAALNFAGQSDRADDLYRKAIADPNLTPSARQNLIEDLNQDGFANLKQLGPSDLPLITKRLALIDQLAPRATDPVSVAAFAEAKKDLLAMQAKAQRPAPPKK